MPTVDINFINPFIKATLTVFDMLGMSGGKFGKPSISDLHFPKSSFLIQIGVTGGMKGQVVLGLTEDRAKFVASTMMMGMPVNELDEMACSALGELGNMIMGNTATIFSTMNITFDITPPLSMQGDRFKLQTESKAIKIPIILNDDEVLGIYVCISEADDV